MIFRCNICGAEGAITSPPHRELVCCKACGSNARLRGIAFAVQSAILRRSDPLHVASPQKNLRGVGFSDHQCCAKEFERLFSYVNTYYHAEPRLDLMNRMQMESFGPVDFVVCSDVLEHVPPPAIEAFENLRRLVRIGGPLILSVPYLEGYETIEHYPHLDRWNIIDAGGEFFVDNIPPGQTIVERHRNPQFHGGPGQVLEMRVFGEGDLVARLKYAGFDSVQFIEPTMPEIGYVWFPTIENSLWRGRAAKSYVMICR
jgi:SAM-dependent methyltransferase